MVDGLFFQASDSGLKYNTTLEAHSSLCAALKLFYATLLLPLGLRSLLVLRLVILLRILDGFPFHAERRDETQQRDRQADVEISRDRPVIGAQHPVSLRGGDDVEETCRPVGDDAVNVDARNIGQSASEEVGEDVLGYGDDQRGPDADGERHGRQADGDVFGGQRRLDGRPGLGECEADAEAEEDLPSYPGWRSHAGLKSGQEAVSNGHHGRPKQHEWRIVTDKRHNEARADGRDSEADDGGQEHRPGLNG